MRTDLIKTEVKNPEKNSGLLDFVIAFDTTGSMNSYIGDVKKHVQEAVYNTFNDNPNIQMSIVAFGDYCDMKSQEDFGDAYQVLDLTSDQDKLVNFILKAKSTSGGDGDEFYELVINKITNETSWRKGSQKLVLLIADANPHKANYTYKRHKINITSSLDWREEAKKSSELGIQWDTLSIKHSYAEFYRELSEITNGVHLPFKSSNKTSSLVTASALSRGPNKEVFFKSMGDHKDDMEMTAVYNAYTKKINK